MENINKPMGVNEGEQTAPQLATAKMLLTRMAEISLSASDVVGDNSDHWKDYYLGQYRLCVDLAVELGIISEV